MVSTHWVCSASEIPSGSGFASASPIEHSNLSIKDDRSFERLPPANTESRSQFKWSGMVVTSHGVFFLLGFGASGYQ